MNLKNFLTRNWIHIAAVLLMLILSSAYFSLQFKGYGLKQHDTKQWKGMSNEVTDYRDRTGKEALWTNSMFGGMPATQISVMYEGNYVKTFLNEILTVYKGPAGIVLLYMIGFYILMMCLRINPWVGILASIAFGFSSYDIIIIQAGHTTKAVAIAFIAPVLGGFIVAYKRSLKWGIILSALFMALELSANHVQVTYYAAFILVATGIVFLIEAIRKKTIKQFSLATVGILGAYFLALLINYGNISLTQDYVEHTIRGGNDIKTNPDGTSNSGNATTGLDRDYVTQWSYGIGESFTLLSPYVKGGGTVALGESPFAESVEDMDLTSEEINGVMNYPVYWGEQPITSGPVYIGIIVCFLALLGIVFLKNPLKWALLAVTVLALALSWGKNFMGLTDFFLDHVPGYNKFRAVTIILILVEFCIPLLGALFLDMLIKERENLKLKKKQFLITSVTMLVFLVILKVAGLGDGYASSNDTRQVAGIENNIREQIKGMDPSVLQAQYKIDVNNEAQVNEFVSVQAEPYKKNFETMKSVRESVFSQSMNRSILFLVLAAGLIALLFYTALKAEFIVVGLIVLVSLDLIPVAWNYLGTEESGSGYKHWDTEVNALYPTPAGTADMQILESELAANPSLSAKIEEGVREGRNKADELGVTGAERRRIEDSYKFSALNRNTNYRVFDFGGGFSSADASYFHKSLGGYHGAKLRNIQNLFDYHLSRSNNKVYDMLNVKYFIQQDQQGNTTARPNPTALGNAWFVRKINTFSTPDEEIRALGNRFTLKNDGQGTLLINGQVKQEANVYGSENLQYVLQSDTMNVPLSNGLYEGMQALFVMDVNGKTNLIPKQTMDLDTARSFLRLVEITASDEFKPAEEAVMLQSEAQKLSATQFSGEGEIRMTSYAPNRITYESNAQGKQFAVFSEIYYPDGWKAFVDGKEVEIRKTDYLLRGLELSGGKHTIEFKFDLPKFHQANTVARISSILLFLLIIGGIVMDVRNKKKLKSQQ